MLKVRFFALVVMGGLALSLIPVSNALDSSQKPSELIGATLAAIESRGWCDPIVPTQELEESPSTPSHADSATIESSKSDIKVLIALLNKVLNTVNDHTMHISKAVELRIQELGLTTSMLEFARYLSESYLTPEEEAKIRKCLEPFDQNPDAQARMGQFMNSMRRILINTQQLNENASLKVIDLFEALLNSENEDFSAIGQLEYICGMLLRIKYQVLLNNKSNPFPPIMAIDPTTEERRAENKGDPHDFLSCVKKVIPEGNMLITEAGKTRSEELGDQQMFVCSTWQNLNPLVGQLARVKGFENFLSSFAKQELGLDKEQLVFLSAKLDQIMGAGEAELSKRIELVRRMFDPSAPQTPFEVFGFLKNLTIMTPNAFTELLFMEDQVYGLFSSICYGLLSTQTFQTMLDRWGHIKKP